MSVPSNTDFATEVKSDRLGVLWKVAFWLGVGVLWIAIATSIIQRGSNPVTWLLSSIVLMAGAWATREFLRRDRYDVAVWMFVLGGLLSSGVLLFSDDPIMRGIVPFIFPVLMFLFGLLATPASTVLIALLSSVLIVGISAISGGTGIQFTPPIIASLALIVLTVVLSSQVSGELYQVTEWALSNYERERRTNHELFEKRQELQMALKRAQVLGEDLQVANKELESAKQAAEEAKHFRGQFLANMSHELRTPLNAIIGFSETMLNFPIMYDDVKLPPQYEADLRQIYSSGKSLLGLINDILDLAKVDAGKLEVVLQPIELEPIFKGVMSTAQGLVGPKPIDLKRDTPTALPKAYADETRVRQVLLNLYSNAAKFTDKGNITLHAREIEDGIQISLSDTGSGIDSKDLTLIFEEFKQASNAGRDPRAGAGLGLAISRQLMSLMGGRIWAESEPGKGSTFHFVIPKHLEQPAQITSAVQQQVS